jgi:thiamine biosynthesis lipoprotein
MNRRDFFRSRQLGETAGQLFSALRPAQLAAAPPESYALLRLSRRAMATTFEILLPFGTPDGYEAGEEALDLIDRLEEQLSVFRESSEVSELNRLAAAEAVVVEERLFELLRLAAQISRDTGGAYDITTSALTKAWGFYRRRGQVPTKEERQEVLARTGMRHVLFDHERRAVRYLRPGLEINLGSIGKGYALDRAAELLRAERKISAGLLHGGQSSVYAMGGEPGDGRGWLVGVTHPWDPERRLATLRLKDRALATSAATFQHLEHRGRKLGHIIDPRTGWPAERLASATVVAPTAAAADALSTAFFVLGVDGARRYCEAHPDVGALLLPTGATDPLVFGLAANEIELAPSI